MRIKKKLHGNMGFMTITLGYSEGQLQINKNQLGLNLTPLFVGGYKSNVFLSHGGVY
jgi:hypothetical protein